MACRDIYLRVLLLFISNYLLLLETEIIFIVSPSIHLENKTGNKMAKKAVSQSDSLTDKPKYSMEPGAKGTRYCELCKAYTYGPRSLKCEMWGSVSRFGCQR